MSGVLHGDLVDLQYPIPGLEPPVLVGGAIGDDLLHVYTIQDGIGTSDQDESGDLRTLVDRNLAFLVRCYF